jgi:hypothetical protein
MLVLVTIMTQAVNNVLEYWLSLWTTAYVHHSAAAYYQTVYILLAACLVVGYFAK